VDLESKKKVSGSVARQVVARVESFLSGADAVLISDYDKGLVTKDIAQSAINAARERGIATSANPKPRNLANFAGAGVITLNQHEAEAGSGLEIDGLPRLERAGRKLLGIAQCGGLIVTRGAAGLSIFEGPERVTHIPAIQSEVYDVAGAGDTVVSALTMALACGASLVNAATIANCSGGAVVRKVGVATTTIAEIRQLLKS
jgi:D-beta-D-heptose 7-phosphate kinase/D-beta-D-heptose 1-phosphate adenosyltransferase